MDPTTNEMLVADFDLAAYLVWARGRPVSGSGVLANFLHEWTHRWCFHSLVGSAIALLRMRGACRTYRGRSAFDDYVRCMTASLALEPLAEGLAEFAELDTYPGNSSWVSQTLVSTMLFFAPAIKASGRRLIPVEALLQALRRDPMLLERKAGIYAQRADVFDPYLVGYLSVRSLWYRMASACTELYDRDFFLSYLRSYIYDDPGMVLRMLGEYPSEVHAANAIVNHLASRVKDLLSVQGLAQRVRLWRQSAHRGKLDLASIGANPGDEQHAVDLITHGLVAHVEDETDKELAAWMLMTLQEREICVVASTAVELRPQPEAHVLDIIAPGLTEPVGTVAAESLPEEAEGELVIVASSDAHAAATLLRVDREVRQVASFGRFDAGNLELARRHLANRPISLSLHQEFSSKLESSSVVATVWGFVQQQVRRAMRGIFGPLCTLNAKEEDWRRAFDELARGGLLGLLGKDAELTRALAAIGLANTVSVDVGVVTMIGRMLEVDDTAMEQAINLSPRHGLPLVARHEGSVLALV